MWIVTLSEDAVNADNIFSIQNEDLQLVAISESGERIVLIQGDEEDSTGVPNRERSHRRWMRGMVWAELMVLLVSRKEEIVYMNDLLDLSIEAFDR